MISFDDDTLQYPKKRQRRSDLSAEVHYNDDAAFSRNVLNDFPDKSLADFRNASKNTSDEIDNVSSSDNFTSSDIKNVINNALNNSNVNNNLVNDKAAVNSDNNLILNKAISKETLIGDNENFEDSFVLKSRKLNQLVDFDLPEVC